MKVKTRENGFTIVELLVVIVVIAILAAVAVVAYNGVRDRATDSLIKDGLAKAVKSLKLDKVDRGTFASQLSDLAKPLADNGSIAYEYTTEGEGLDRTYCLTGTSGTRSLHVQSDGTGMSVLPGVCTGHNDPNAPPPEIVFSSTHDFTAPSQTTPVPSTAEISYNLSPSDLVFVIYNLDFYNSIQGVSAGSQAGERVYRKSMGASGYQQIFAYKLSGLSGPQTLTTNLCWGGYNQSACYEGSDVRAEYIVYVVRGKSNPTITATDTSFGSQAKDAAVTPAAQTVSRRDVAFFSYVYYGNYMPTLNDVSSPGVSWQTDAERSSPSARPGFGGTGLSSYHAVIDSSGNVERQLVMPSSGAVYAGATLFVVK